MKYSVWLLTRPIKVVSHLNFTPLADFSVGKEYLHHWGILVSEMNILDAQAILLRKVEYGGNDATELRTLYELTRSQDSRNTVKTTRPFRTEAIRTLRREWGFVDFQFVGETEYTHESILLEGNLSGSKRFF